MEDYFHSEDTTYLFTIRLSDQWKWTFDMVDYNPNDNLPNYLLKNRTITSTTGRASFVFVNEKILGSIEYTGKKYRFLPATYLLGASWSGYFLVYEDPHYTYSPPANLFTDYANIELGFEADYELYQQFGGNADGLDEIAGIMYYILDDVQIFYEINNNVNVVLTMKVAVARIAPDNYVGPPSQIFNRIRNHWKDTYPCVPVDAVILFSKTDLANDGATGFLQGGDVFCNNTLPVAYVDVSSTGFGAGPMSHTSLTLAHEIGHMLTQRPGHTENSSCPLAVIASCGNTAPTPLNKVPLMCGDTYADNLSEVFLPQCDIDNIINLTIEGDGPICLDVYNEPPPLPCPTCELELTIKPNNSFPLKNCGDRNEIEYEIEICNYCVDQSIVVTFKSPFQAQTVAEIDPLFSLNNTTSTLEYYTTQPFTMTEGECKKFKFKTVLNSAFSNAQFSTSIEAEPSGGGVSWTESATIFTSNNLLLNVPGGTLSSLLNLIANVNLRTQNVCGNFNLPGVFSFSGITEIDLDNAVFTYTGGGSNFQNEYCFDNRILKMAENAKILIKNGTLHISDSRILGCSSLWNSIIVEPGATLIIENTFVEDGEYAIQVKPGAHVEIKNCTFRDNYVAFYVADGGSALPQSIDLVQFYGNVIETQDALKAPRAGQKAYAGMLLNNATGIVVGNESDGIERNRFRNLCSGIVSINTNMSVINTVFQDIYPAGIHAYNGYAIYANARPTQLRSLYVKGLGKTGDPVIVNCASGISANGLNAKVEQCNIENVVFGIASIQSRYRTIRFLDNNISSTGSGIRLIGNTPAYIKVENNELSIDDATGASPGILVSENFVAVASHAANRVAKNTINLYKGRAGILSYSGRYFEFYENTITLQYDEKQSAIQIEGMADGLVRCNIVNSMTNTTLNNRGIVAKGAYSSIFSCNHLNDTKIGMSFDGMGDQSVVRGNEFNGQAVGLQMEMNGHVGEQIHQGNRWFGSFGEFGAKHLGDETSVDLSPFIVDADEAIGQPFVYLPTLSASATWFEDQDVFDPEMDIFYCTTTAKDACATASPPVNIKGGMGDLEEKLARGSFTSPQFTTELTWTGRRHLYSRIAENNIPLQNYAQVNSFYTNAANSVIEQLHEAGQSIKDALTLSATDETALENYTSSIESSIADLHQNSEALSIATTSTSISSLLADRATILSDLGETTEDTDAFSTDLYNNLLSSIGAAKTVNSSVSATAVYELNEKDYNSLFLTSIEQDTFTISQKNALWSIANQCPLEGGDGVYHARSLYALVNPFATYNDLTLCGGSQSLQRPAQETEKPAVSFYAYPNPAKEVLAFKFDEPLNEPVLLEIFQVSGYQVHRQLHDAADGQFLVQTDELKDGLYFCRLSLNGRDLGTCKVVVMK